MSNWKYYDTTKEMMFNLKGFELETNRAGVIINNTPDNFNISFDTTFFDEDYVGSMVKEYSSIYGEIKLKKDITRNILLINDDGTILELLDCMLKNLHFNEDGGFDELKLTVDGYVIHLDSSDRHHEILRMFRNKKLDNLLQ